MNRQEQLTSLGIICGLLVLQILATVLMAAPTPSGPSGPRVGAFSTDTPVPSPTLPATPTPLPSGMLGIPQGAVRSGYLASYTSGAAIAHGLPGTPKACVVTVANGAVTLTVTSIVLASSVFTVTGSPASVPIFWICSQ